MSKKFIMVDEITFNRLLDYLTRFTGAREAHMGDHTAYSTHIPVKELHDLINELKQHKDNELPLTLEDVANIMYWKGRASVDAGKSIHDYTGERVRKLKHIMED